MRPSQEIQSVYNSSTPKAKMNPMQYNNSIQQRQNYIDPVPENYLYSEEHRMAPPYGIRFGEENQVREKERAQYRKDLDYLVGLRRPYGDMTQKEWEEYNRKINYMNDRYAYGELDNRNFLRGMNRGYEDEANMRKAAEKRRKEEENELERKRLQSIREQEALEDQKLREQKQRILNQQINDLNDYKKRKEILNRQKELEGLADKKLVEEHDNNRNDSYNAYKNKILDNNRRIYGNAQLFNGLVGSPINKEAFNSKNDFEFNKYVAFQRERERKANRFNPNLHDEIMKEMEKDRQENRKLHQDKLDSQKLYKEYLDNQNEVNYLTKMNQPIEDSRPQLLMPAYWYPNRPIPLHRKARDSLLASKHPKEYFDKDMGRFFHWDSQYATLMDYDINGNYLGDSALRHNPITCPVNDYYYNKYVNRLKKNSEYIPQTNRSAPRVNPRGYNYHSNYPNQ